MSGYDRRDLIGHWVRKQQPTQRVCGHACCRGRRVHPENYPVILPSALLRKASDDDLARGYDLGTSERQAQILHELERRDRDELARRQRAKDKNLNAFRRKMAHAEEIDRAWLEAEHATNGNMVNARGRARGITDRELFTADERTARRYASDELLGHWQTHHRPTAAFMQGKDTRLGALYTAPRRKKYGVGRVSLHRGKAA